MRQTVIFMLSFLPKLIQINGMIVWWAIRFIYNLMQIENQLKKKKILKTSTGDYDLEWCRWRVLGQQLKKKRQIFNPNTKGYIHGAIILKNTLYALLSPEEASQSSQMYSFNFKTNEWKNWEDCNLPENRDSFGLTSHKNELYMYGGSNYDTQFGDLRAFNTLSSYWRLIEVSCTPKPRNPLIFTDISNSFIFLYGGVNLQNGEILNDAFAFVDQSWIALQKIINPPLNLVGAQSAACKQNVYIFGGQYQDSSTGLMLPNKTLYKLQINLDERSVEFIALPSKYNDPCSRTSHSMANISDQYLILIGGMNLPNNKMLRDIWLYDIILDDWVKIDPANGPLHPLCDNTLLLHKSSIMILGGLTDHHNMWNQQILGLQFGESQPYKNQICTNCIQRSVQREKQEKSFPKTVVLSSGFFYTISLQIKHPFQAIQLLIDCSAYLNSTKFKISINKCLNDTEHVEVQFDGQSLDRAQFQHLIAHSNPFNEHFSKFMTNLKIASLRLGKTMIFVTAGLIERKVFMFSSDSKITPYFDESYSFCGYIENIKKSMVESHEGKLHKQLILNVLRSRVQNPQELLNVTNINKIYIFEKNILVTADKVYYYQLISTNNDDISVYKSAKKLQFLDELGYEISKEPQISLRSYLSLCRLPSIQSPTYIVNSKQNIRDFDYISKLKALQSEGKIISFEMPTKIHDIEIESILYIAENEDVIINNFGLIIYHEGRLVNRMGHNFGDLFKEEFYKTKYKKALTVFEYLGVVNIKKGLTINYFGTWLKKNKNYYLFLESLKDAMRKAKLEKSERNLKQEGDMIEQGRSNKRIR